MVRISVLLILIVPSFVFSQVYSRKDSLRGTLSNNRTCFDVKHYDLVVNIDLTNKTIAGSNSITYSLLTPFNEIQLDMFANMVVDSIVSFNRKLSFEREANAVFVKFDTFQVNKLGVLKVFYHGKPREALKPPWDGGVVWSKTALGRPWAAVACEGKGASLWWPCKDHPSDEPDSMRITIGIPTANVQMGDSVVSNGNLVAVINGDHGYTSFVWDVHYPINTYNVTYNIGPYLHVTDSLYGLKMDYYVADTKLSKAIPHFKQSKEMLICFEKLFGPYPFPKDGYALVEGPYWGMEHQGAIAYGNGYKNNSWGFDFIIVHESAHEWWGNSVSCSDHAELWIHESFATYSEALFVEDQFGKQKMLEYLLEQKKRIKNSEPIVGPLGVNYNNWLDSDEYFKGTWMLHTLRNMIDNDSLWFATIKSLALTYRHKVVSTKNIVEFMSKSLKTDLKPFFDQYLFKKDPPVIEYYWKTEKGIQMLYYRLVADVKGLKMRLKAGKINEYKLKIVAENNWKKANVSDRTDFDWAEELFYIIPKEVVP